MKLVALLLAAVALTAGEGPTLPEPPPRVDGDHYWYARIPATDMIRVYWTDHNGMVWKADGETHLEAVIALRIKVMRLEFRNERGAYLERMKEKELTVAQR